MNLSATCPTKSPTALPRRAQHALARFGLTDLGQFGFIDVYHSRIKAFHVKDAEFVMSARSGVYGDYQDWRQRAGRFRSPGDGSIDFKSIFSLLTNHGYDGWASLEWECCFKNRCDGAREGAELIRRMVERWLSTSIGYRRTDGAAARAA